MQRFFQKNFSKESSPSRDRSKPKSSSHFFTKAKNFKLKNVSLQNVEGNSYQYIQNISGVDPDSVELNSMTYASDAGMNETKQCLPGTRKPTLNWIENWALGKYPDAPRVLWLNGPAGTGKSAIAHTAAKILDKHGRLGGFFAFDNSYLSERRHEKIFSTIARNLAARSPAARRELADAIRQDPSLRSTDIKQQWEKLVLKAAAHLSNLGPIFIVLEALDESGDHKSRSHLLSILALRSGELPPNFYILVTSRPLNDISQAFSNSSQILKMGMNDIDMVSTNRDIHTFISNQLGDVENGFFDHHKIDALVRQSEGLFQWAFVACEFIQGNGMICSPKAQYNTLQDSTGRGGMTHLDGLYETVLSAIMGMDGVALFCSVMGQILGSFEPLSIDTLTTLRQYFPPSSGSVGADDISLVVKHMGSLLSGTSDSSAPIRPLHSSFLDYLTDEKRSGEFFIDKSSQQNNLAIATLDVMKAELRFNICNLETSYLLNSEVQGLQERVAQCISPALSYSCRYWARHINPTAFGAELCTRVRHLFSNSFLFWIEVLSLLKCVNTAAAALSLIVKWVNSNADATDIINLAQDAEQFVRMFGGATTQSTPHLYLSAVPFAPQESMIYKIYKGWFPKTPHVASGHVYKWPSCLNVIRGHTNAVSSVAFSPDGRQIISGSRDSTIRIWDAETGVAVGEPLQGHTNAVFSVVFSPDGRQIISGSLDSTIRIWDAETGVAVGEPLQGHTNAVFSVAFSPDGRQIISGSRDSTIRIWDAETGVAVGEPLQGHANNVSSVAFSPDGRQIISGSWDNTIRIWDAKTGVAVGEPLQVHTNAVISVAFSPDGRQIISGSSDNTIQIWDAETGVAVGEPLQGHANDVSSVAFSPDGRQIISCSSDNTIRIWDAETGVAVGEPLQGHANAVSSVAFSPDGRQIISGSWDNTIRIWDAETGVAVGEPLQGHASAVISVAFSPDGRQIISGSRDNTIRIWDAETGNNGALGPVLHLSSNPNHYLPNIHILLDAVNLASSIKHPITLSDNENGWISIGPQRRRLMWLPHTLLQYPYNPCTLRVLGAVSTELDLSQMAHGSLWHQCFQGSV